MQVIKVDKSNYLKGLDKATEALKAGQVIIIPTETVYGLAVLPSDLEAVKRMYQIKKRPLSKPLPLIGSKTSDFEGWAVIEGDALKLAEHFWPGPLTIVVPRGERTDSFITAGKDKVALRVPDHSFVARLIEVLGEPLVASSANLSGAEEPSSVNEIEQEVASNIEIAIDAGETLFEAASTVIDTTRGNIISRPGPITGQEVADVLKVRK